MLLGMRRIVDRVRGDAYQPSKPGGGFHLWWVGMPTAADPDPVVSVSVTLEVQRLPQVPKLYFWALQATFCESDGTPLGAAHTGLQWNPRHPDSRAVNWGGYAANGAADPILPGTPSTLDGIPGDVNTYNYPWRAQRHYRFDIERSGIGWRATVTDMETKESTVVRDLLVGGDRLANVVMWSELFCKGTDPPTSVRWTTPWARRASGEVVQPTGMSVRYPGGSKWRRTNTSWDGTGFVQETDTRRTVAEAAVLRAS